MNPTKKNEEKSGSSPSNMESSTSSDKAEEQEPSDENASEEGVVIPEEYQKKVHEVIEGAKTKHHLSHIRDRVYAKEDEMRKAESKKEKKDKPSGEMSDADMPSTSY